jgi:hypothetical protein
MADETAPRAPQSTSSLVMPDAVVQVEAPSAQNMLEKFWETSSKADIEENVKYMLDQLKIHTDALSSETTAGIVNEDTKHHLSDMVEVMQKIVNEKKGSKSVVAFLKNNEDPLKGAVDVMKRFGGQLGAEIGIDGDEIDLEGVVHVGEGILGKYRTRASTLLESGSDLFQSLLKSEEAQLLQQESTSLFENVANTKGAKMLAESARKAMSSDKVGKILAAAPRKMEEGIEVAEKALETMNVEDIAQSFVDENELAKKIVRGGQGQELLKDLSDSVAVRQLKEGAIQGVSQVKGKGVESSLEETAVSVLERSESLLKEFRATRKGEQILASGLKAYKRNVQNKDALELAVSNAMEEIDMPVLLELADRAWEDEEARAALVIKLSDISLEFLLKSLPAIAIPPISGVDNDVAYTIDGLDMSGFVLDKQNIAFVVCDEKVVNSDSWDGTVFKISAREISSKFPEVKWSYRQNYFPFASGTGVAMAELHNARLSLAFKLVKETLKDGTLVPRLVLAENVVQMEGISLSEKESTMGWVYNMLLGIFGDVIQKYVTQNITEALDVLMEDFFGGINGVAEAINMAPILMKITGLNLAKLEEYDPATMKRERAPSITIEQGSATAGAKNSYSVTFRAEGRIGIRLGSSDDTPGAAVVTAFTKGENGEIYQAEKNGNIMLGDILLEINGQNIVGLPLQKVMHIFQAATRPITLVMIAHAERKVPSDGSKHAIVDVVFAPGPIGLELTSRESSGSSSKGAMIRSFKNLPDGSPGAAERCGKLQASMILHACNDEIVQRYTFENIMKCLRQASRPMVLRFLHDPDITLSFREPGPLGLRLGKFNNFIVVTGFVKIRGPGESTGVIKPGHIVHMLGGQPCTITAGAKRDWTYSEVLNGLRRLPRPIVVRFGPDIQDVWGDDSFGDDNDAEKKEPLSWCDVTFGPGAMGITFKQSGEGRTIVTGFPKLDSPAQKRGDIIRHGMVLLKLNGELLGELSLEEVIERLRTSPPPRTLVLRDQELYSKIHSRDGAQ